MTEPPSVSDAIALSERSAPAVEVSHICVCICTYKRPILLWRLLDELSRQETEGLFTYSVVVADNDQDRSAETTVERACLELGLSIKYCLEPRQNIALARNKVVQNAEGDYLAFVDDDEFPTHTWLLTLFKTLTKYNVDGVLGPVLRHFDETPPKWLKKGRFYVRRVNPTGMKVQWLEARTGNVLLKRELMRDDLAPFHPEFRAGEDQDFFRRKMDEGRAFVWCAEAEVFETVPPARWKRSYLLKKAILRGATAALQPHGSAGIVKSVVAVALYALALLPALLLGQHRCMTILVKLCDHAGKLLMLAGVNPIRGEYIAE